MGHYFYHDYNSNDDRYKVVPSLLTYQLVALLTGHESQTKQKGTPQCSHPAGFIFQFQSTALQDQILAASDSHEKLTTAGFIFQFQSTALQNQILAASDSHAKTYN